MIESIYHIFQFDFNLERSSKNIHVNLDLVVCELVELVKVVLEALGRVEVPPLTTLKQSILGQVQTFSDIKQRNGIHLLINIFYEPS